MDDLAVRTAKPSDIDKLVELRLSLQRHVEKSNPRIWRITKKGAGLLKQGLKEGMKEEGSRIIVATVKGKIVGFAHGQVSHRTDYSPDNIGTIMNIYIQKEFRGKGVGKRLVGELCRFFASEGVRQVTLRYAIGNREAEKFWKGLGFEPVITAANVRLEKLEKRLKRAKEAR